MSTKIVMRCPGCEAKITAPSQLFGHNRHCPGCGTGFVVRPQPLFSRPRRVEDSDPLLVAFETPVQGK